jgi:mannose-6-phosphate isomerase-like protein (cupin superfamily)
MDLDMSHFHTQWIQKRLIILAAAALMGSGAAWGQYGGRPGDAVIYFLTSKGAQDFKALPRTATNSAALLSRFERVDPSTIPLVPLGEGFPEGFRHQILHSESDDLFQLITQAEGDAGAHRIFVYSLKTFITAGIVRETVPLIDYTGNAFTTLKKNVDFGPDLALQELHVIFWGPSNVFPAITVVPQDVSGSDVPPGKTGDDVILDIGVAPFFLPWTPLLRKYPGAGWMSGVDLKLIDTDATTNNSSIQVMRMRPGTHTPLFSNSGSTHFYVMSGTVTLNVAGGASYLVPAGQYAFLPPGLAVTVTNARKYSGPAGQALSPFAVRPPQ